MRINRVLRRLFPQPLKDAYYIGFLKDDDISLSVAERYARIKWLDVGEYGDEGWFADPFIISVGDNILELFAEEMIYETDRGILVYIKVDLDTFRILEKKTILELDTHLSFPIYIEDAGKLYVYPENYQGGSLKIYEYDSTTKSLVCPRTIIDAPLLDTQIAKIDGAFYAFGVQYRTGTQLDTKKLYVYKSNKLHGGYELVQTIENQRCEERGAGLIFHEGGRLFRPAQCCEGGYGKAVIIYELQQNGFSFEEKEFKRIIPDRDAPNGNILHTYNKKNGWVAIDGWRYRYPHIASMYKKIRRID